MMIFPLLEVAGAPIEVYVSAVSSPARFWVQFVGSQVAQLDELVQQMTDYYSNKDNRDAHAVSMSETTISPIIETQAGVLDVYEK